MSAKVKQLTVAQAERELALLLSQLKNNTSELARRCPRGIKPLETLNQLYEAANAIEEWYGLSGEVRLVVHFSPRLPNFGDDDSAYAFFD
jgi:hypothetical protein